MNTADSNPPSSDVNQEITDVHAPAMVDVEECRIEALLQLIDTVLNMTSRHRPREAAQP